MRVRHAILMALAGLGALACSGEEAPFGGSGNHGVPVGGDGGIGPTTSTTSSGATGGSGTSTTTDTGTTTSTDTGPTTSTTTNAGGAGGEGGSPTCSPPMHWCGDDCAGNTPETGCFLSGSCAPCSPVTHANLTCTGAGECAFECQAPYTPAGDECVCPTECCAASDCQFPAVCTNGTCGSTACDDISCMLECYMGGYLSGVCVGDDCVCS